MSDSLQAAAQLRGRLVLVLAVRQALRDLTLFAIVLGVLTLIVRTTLVRTPVSAQAVGAVLTVALIVSMIRGARRAPSQSELVALLDAESHCGGLLIAAESTDIGKWRDSLAAINVPRVRFDASRTWLYTAAAIAFAVATLFVPQREASATRHGLDVRTDIAREESRLKLLEEEKLLPPDRAEAMKQSLEALKKEASGDDPSKTWETLDSLADANSRAARDAAEAALRKTESLSRVEAMASLLEGNTLTGNDLANGMRAMSDEASKPETLSAIPDDLKDALAKNTLTDAQMREVANAARQGKDALRKTLSKLSAAGLIDPKSLAKHDQLAQSADKADLAKYLKDHAGEQGWGAALGQYMAGRGGRDRGRGDAAMFFGEKADDKGTKWDEKTLPPATAAGLQNSTKVGVSAAVPDAAHPITSSGGALASATAGGGSAYTSVVLPRHRGAVKRYFERK